MSFDTWSTVYPVIALVRKEAVLYGGLADYVTGYTKYNERSDSSSEIGGCIVWGRLTMSFDTRSTMYPVIALVR